MSQQTTIRKLAELVNTPVEKLLEQLSEAGMSFSGPDQVVTSTEKIKLLGFLRRTHGKADEPAEDTAAPKKITLNRRKVQEVTVASGRSKSTVAVEVRQKRTYVKPEEGAAPVVVDSSPAAQAAAHAGDDPERAEILRKLEESRQRNLTEQQRLAETDAKRRAEAAERKRLEDEAAERERQAAVAAAAEAAVAEESAKPKAGHHGHPKPAPPRVDDKGAAHKGAKANRGSHAMVTSIEDDENAARFAGQLHLSASERARRSSARGRPKQRRQLDQSRTGSGFTRPLAPIVR